MKRTTETIHINALTEIPSLSFIRVIPREQELKLLFGKSCHDQREGIGEQLKKDLKGFLVGIHIHDPIVTITKLITDEEIETHKLFFEQCAKDYRELSTALIKQLAQYLKVKINPSYPLKSFNQYKSGHKQLGKFQDWNYNIHGFHCGFTNRLTGQELETHLVFGLEFGDLDPYFFAKYIKSTPAYQPLPVPIFDDYWDGCRIIEKMLSLGLFEKVNSNLENSFGIVVTDREKIDIQTYSPAYEASKKSILQLWKFWGRKP